MGKGLRDALRLVAGKTNLRGIAAAAVLTVSATSCATGSWLQSGRTQEKTANNPDESTVTAANVDQLEVVWSESVGTDAREAVVKNGTAYVRSNGAVTALNLGSGAAVWSLSSYGTTDTPLAGRAVPAVVGDTLRVPAASTRCDLVSVDLASGQDLGYTRFNAPFDLPSSFTQGCVTADALETGGDVVVPYFFGASGLVPRDPCGTPAIVWGVFVGVATVDLGGSPAWTGVGQQAFGCGGVPDPLPLLPAYNPVSVSGDHALVARGNVLSAYPLAGCTSGTACPTWSVDVGGPIFGPAVALPNGDIAVSRDDQQLVVVDGTTHTVEWTAASLRPFATANITATDTTIFVANYLSMSAFPIDGCGGSTCTPTWTTPLPETPTARPSVGGDVVYVGTFDGSVTALPAAGCGSATCAPLWSHTTGSSITGAPVIVDGTLVVGSENGTVTAFRLPA